MLKILCRRHMSSSARTLRRLGATQAFQKRLQAPELWRWSRRTVAASVLIGLFVAILPLPMQMLLAGLAAIVWRANLPLAVALVWLSNPVTVLPLAWCCTWVGCLLLNLDPAALYTLQFEGFAAAVHWLWKPLFVGSLACAAGIGALGYYLTLLCWRANTAYRWHARPRRVIETVAKSS